MNENTTDSILTALENMAKSKTPIDPTQWVEGAAKLITLMGGENDALFLLEQKVAQARIESMASGMTATAAKMHSEATDEYREARQQKAKIDRIIETVRLAKLRGRMANDEMRSQ